MNKEELIEKLNELENRFYNDVEVNGMIEKLKEKFDTLFEETFTKEEVESDDFDEMGEEYYSDLCEDDPDNATVFQVMWFK
jgi:predicted transcriptional regulator YdeE